MANATRCELPPTPQATHEAHVRPGGGAFQHLQFPNCKASCPAHGYVPIMDFRCVGIGMGDCDDGARGRDGMYGGRGDSHRRTLQ